jgi:hypothetical protein
VSGNDGTFLRQIDELTHCRTVNIEPAANMAAITREADIETLSCFFDEAAVAALRLRHGGASLVVATNTFNHASEPAAFVGHVARLLQPGGVFVFEVPSLRDLVRRRAFDTIYLEHVSYFGLKPLLELFELHELGIVDAETIDYMGGSLRVTAVRGGEHAASVRAQAATEEREGLYRLATYEAFARAIERCRDELTAQLCAVKAAGGTIIGVGAAAKGNTLLNYGRIGPPLLACVTDASSHKIGKFTPGMHVPIVADADMPAETTHALILPWNIAPFLIDKLRRPGLEFIVPRMELP